MKREFVLRQGGVKRLTVTYEWNLANARVFLNGKELGSFAKKADFERGDMFTLPDGSKLLIRYGPIEGAPFLKGVHLLHNDVPVPGSAAEPLPKWALAFMVACAVIPVVSLGGALPAVLAILGVQVCFPSPGQVNGQQGYEQVLAPSSWRRAGARLGWW